MFYADDFKEMPLCSKDGKSWHVARGIPDSSIFVRIKEAWAVLIGKAEAIKFYEE